MMTETRREQFEKDWEEARIAEGTTGLLLALHRSLLYLLDQQDRVIPRLVDRIEKLERFMGEHLLIDQT